MIAGKDSHTIGHSARLRSVDFGEIERTRNTTDTLYHGTRHQSIGQLESTRNPDQRTVTSEVCQICSMSKAPLVKLLKITQRFNSNTDFEKRTGPWNIRFRAWCFCYRGELQYQIQLLFAVWLVCNAYYCFKLVMIYWHACYLSLCMKFLQLLRLSFSR